MGGNQNNGHFVFVAESIGSPKTAGLPAACSGGVSGSVKSQLLAGIRNLAISLVGSADPHMLTSCARAEERKTMMQTATVAVLEQNILHLFAC